MLQHVMGVACSEVSLPEEKHDGQNLHIRRDLAALASICPADCSSVPLTAASQPVSHPLPLFFSLVLACVSRAHCVARVVYSAPILMP